MILEGAIVASAVVAKTCYHPAENFRCNVARLKEMKYGGLVQPCDIYSERVNRDCFCNSCDKRSASWPVIPCKCGIN